MPRIPSPGILDCSEYDSVFVNLTGMCSAVLDVEHAIQYCAHTTTQHAIIAPTQSVPNPELNTTCTPSCLSARQVSHRDGVAEASPSVAVSAMSRCHCMTSNVITA